MARVAVATLDAQKQIETQKQIDAKVEEGQKPKEITETVVDGNSFVVVDKAGSIDFIMDKKTLTTYAYIGGELIPIDKIKKTQIENHFDIMQKEKKKIEKIASTIKKVTSWQMGDTTLLYGPTGTGKTHSVLSWCASVGLPYEVVTVSDGFEDIDFLTYILPTEKGIQYTEKSILPLLRRASKGEKVAVLVDEFNRGSKSFLNLLLKMLDNVGGTYTINNFVADEKIVIPRENIIRFCTANLGGGYVGTNDIDEALFDRFNKIEFVTYDPIFEKSLLEHFGTYKEDVEKIVNYLRELFKDNAIKRPISSRGLKIRTEEFLNSPQTKTDVFATFEKTIMYRLVGVDAYGSPIEGDIGVLASKFMELGFITKK